MFATQRVDDYSRRQNALELTKNKQIAMTSAHMIDSITYTIIQN